MLSNYAKANKPLVTVTALLQNQTPKLGTSGQMSYLALP